MNPNSKKQVLTREVFRLANADSRLKELGIELLAPPEPFGTYVEAAQTGNLLFLGGMLPTEGREAKFVGRVGIGWHSGQDSPYPCCRRGDFRNCRKPQLTQRQNCGRPSRPLIHTE